MGETEREQFLRVTHERDRLLAENIRLEQEVESLCEEAARLEQISRLLLLAAEKEPLAAIKAFVRTIREG
jgi:cell division septum initiation protein DivIVA